MADGGLSDYASAKRKAARSLGLPENSRMPDNSEIEAELRIYQRLFQGTAHAAAIAYLRRKAVEIMAIMQPFNPYLTGPVLDGTAGPYTEIDIQLFTDTAKDVEIFLLNKQIDYTHCAPRSERAEAVLAINGDDTVVNLVIYPSDEERIAFKTRDGRLRDRARIEVVEDLLTRQ